MLPFVACMEMATAWQPLVESVWKGPAVRRHEPRETLLDWWDLHWNQGPIVLDTQPWLMKAQLAWPPPQLLDRDNRIGRTWQDLRSAIAAIPRRTVTAGELAALMHARGLDEIQLLQPSLARHLFFRARQESPLVIREQEHPGGYVLKLKRAAP
jgi:hypothetical protein